MKIIGENPLQKNANGECQTRIATIFPRAQILITLPGVHATQRLAYIELLNAERLAAGQPALTEDGELEVMQDAVDLIVEKENLLIRPDPQNMALAFEADELLQTLVPTHRVRFLFVRNASVYQALKRRGECWRLTGVPRSAVEMKQMICRSLIGIGGRAIYYYNRARGTRLLTYDQFASLSTLSFSELRQLLGEIGAFSSQANRLGSPDIVFFMAEGLPVAEFNIPGLEHLTETELRSAYESLKHRFRSAVKPEFRVDDPEDPEWRRAMFAALMSQRDEVLSEETLLGLSPEFYMQIEWLPGGRIEAGELILDSVFESGGNGDAELRRLHDAKAHGFIFNFIREHGDLEYVNIGRVVQSLSRRPTASGRRDVYIAELKQRESDNEIVRIIRMQKWGVREHLDEGKSLLEAMVESEEYTEYIMDRRLGCRQLGMHLPAWITAKRIAERYDGRNCQLHGTWIWSTYFEREYIRGIATDKMPASRLEHLPFALSLARVLGQAAAPNIIVGRTGLEGQTIFDDGDEVVMEDGRGMPVDIIVADHTGTFGDYRSELTSFATAYAAPVIKRSRILPDRAAFAAAYLDAFQERFAAIQQEYRKRRRAFNTLFQHRTRHEGGSFAYRWEQVLKRLDRTDAAAVRQAIELAIARG